MRGISIATVIVSMVCAAAISAVLAATLPDILRSSTTTERSAAAPTSERGQLLALEARLNDLEQRVGQLADRPGSAPTGPIPSDLAGRMARLESQLRSVSASVANHDSEAKPGGAAPAGNSSTNAPAMGNPTGGEPVLTESQVEAVTRATLKKVEQERAEEQERRNREQMEEYRKQRDAWMDSQYTAYTDRLMRELGTSPQQLDTVKVLLAERKQNMMRLYDPTIPQEEKKSWDDYNTEFDTKIQSVLSTQQYEIYKQKQLDDFRTLNTQNDQGQQQGGPGRRPNGNRPTR